MPSPLRERDRVRVQKQKSREISVEKKTLQTKGRGMDKKTKDSVFAVILIVLGVYVVWEGLAMVSRASEPPYRIEQFRNSPGMLPVVLGAGLIFFSLLLLAGALRGETHPVSSLRTHLKTGSIRFGRALGEIDVRSMTVSVVIMAIYTFFVLGNVPFWLGALAFLAGLMLFLRAGKLWVILTASAVSVALIIILFQNFFKTVLP